MRGLQLLPVLLIVAMAACSNETKLTGSSRTPADDAAKKTDDLQGNPMPEQKAGAPGAPVEEPAESLEIESGSSAGTALKLAKLVVDPDAVTVNVGGTATFKAYNGTANPANLLNDAKWSIDSPTVAEIATKDGNGVITTKAVGQAVVTATRGSESASALVTVVAQPPKLVALEVNPVRVETVVGAIGAFSAKAVYTDGSIKDVTEAASWQVDVKSIAELLMPGKFIGRAPGNATVHAEFDGIAGSAQIDVGEATLERIEITPAPPPVIVPAGLIANLAAIGEYSDGSKRPITHIVTWAAANAAVADVSNDAASKGRVKAKSSVGSTEITAVLGEIKGQTTVQVTIATPTQLEIAAVKAPSAYIGEQIQFKATLKFSDGSTADVTQSVAWTSSEVSIASISNAAATKGLATAAASGKSKISASLSSPNLASNIIELEVAKPVVSWFRVTPASTLQSPIVLALDARPLQLRAHVKYAHIEDPIEMTNDPSCVWTSGDATKASVSNAAQTKGQVTAVAAGAPLIKVACLDFNGEALNGEAFISVPVSVVLTNLTIARAAGDGPIGIGAMIDLIATAHFSDGSSQNVTAGAAWSSNSGRLVVQAVKGRFRGTGPLFGDATATVTAAFGGKSRTFDVTVRNSIESLALVRVAPVTGSLSIGQDQTLRAEARYADGSTRDVTGLGGTTWTSLSANALAAMPTKGMFRALNFGPNATSYTATAKATFEGKEGTLALNIQRLLSSISIEFADASNGQAFVDEFIKLQVVAHYDNGSSEVIASPSYTFDNNSGVFGTPTAQGFQALAVGQADVRASYQGLSNTKRLRVVHRSCSISVGVGEQYGRSVFGHFFKPHNPNGPTAPNAPTQYDGVLRVDLPSDAIDIVATVNRVVVDDNSPYLVHVAGGVNTELLNVPETRSFKRAFADFPGFTPRSVPMKPGANGFYASVFDCGLNNGCAYLVALNIELTGAYKAARCATSVFNP